MAMEIKHLSTQNVMDVTGKAIDEIRRLRQENAEMKERYKYMDTAHTVHIAKMNARIEELESNERRIKRELWLARANRALEKIAWFKLWNASISTMNPEDCARQEYDKWKKALGKFLKKAELTAFATKTSSLW